MTRSRAAFDLFVASAFLSLRLWTDSSAVLSKPLRTAVAIATVVVIGCLFLREGPSLQSLGLRPRSWIEGLRSLILGTLVAIVFLVGLGAAQGTLFAARDLGKWLGSVWHLALLQQILLQGFLAPRVGAVLHDAGVRGSLATAVVFSFFHLPNPILTPLAFLGAFGWCEWFRRHHNLPALWASHLALGFAVIATQDPELLRRMRVGAAYIHFRN